MRTHPRPRSALGSTLLLVVILIGVLAAVGAAAVALSSRDRINASAKSRRDLMVSCAQAAQAKVWADLARFGRVQSLSGTGLVSEFTLADGTRLGTLHYDQQAGVTTVEQVILKENGEFGDEAAVDLTNRSSAISSAGKSYGGIARCTVPAGNLGGPDRQLEVEFQFRLSL